MTSKQKPNGTGTARWSDHVNNNFHKTIPIQDVLSMLPSLAGDEWQCFGLAKSDTRKLVESTELSPSNRKVHLTSTI